MAKTEEALDLDIILDELGSFGRYQLRTYLLILVPIVCSGAYNGNFIFNAGETPHRCMVPECESAPFQWTPGYWGEWALLKSSKCERTKPRSASSACSPEAFELNQTTKCTAFVYENEHTIVSAFDLACQDWKRTTVGTVRSFGTFSALIIVGFLSDTYGRRIMFILSASLRSLAGVARSFSTNYIMYLIFEYTEAAISSGVYSTGFILALEMISLDRRVLAGSMISASFATGQMLLAAISWNFSYWRTLTLVLYSPGIIFLSYFFLIEESVRWLLSKGEHKEAVRIIFKAADVNNAELSSNTMKILLAEPPPVTKPTTTTDMGTSAPQKSLAKQVMGSRIMMSRLCICSFWWITVTFIYYGLSINSVSLGGNMHVNYILSSLVEIPGYCMSTLTLDRFGRKSSIMTSLFICGTSLIALPFVPATLVWGQLSLSLVGKMFASAVISSIYVYTTEMFPTLVRHRVLAFCCLCGRVGEMLAPQTPLLVLTLLGKLCISMVFTSIYIYTTELFPTRARHSLMGFCSTAGRIGTMCAPQTPLLMAYMKSLPYLIFGAMAGCAGLLMLLTPETLRMRLPDTVAEAENMAAAPHVRHAHTDIINDKFIPSTK